MTRAIAAAALGGAGMLVVLVSGCTRGPSPGPRVEGTFADPLCELISVPASSLAESGDSFAEVVARSDERAIGIGAILLFATGRDADEAGEFQPVVEYLAARAWAEVEREQGQPYVDPALTAAIRSNAEALDGALASGRCDG